MKNLIACLFTAMLTTNMNAQIIYTDIIPDSITDISIGVVDPYLSFRVSNQNIAPIDFNNDGTEEYNFRSDYDDNGPWYLHFTGIDHEVLNGTNVEPMTAGLPINSESNWGVMFTQPWLSHFQNLGDRYIGCKFTLGANTHYGWIRVSFNNDLIFTVKDYAYESTPDTPINAGDKSSTILVNSINVQGQTGATTIAVEGGTLQMETTVLPVNATDNSVTWSVSNETGSATISTSGSLTANTNGTVAVTATANDGSNTFGSTVITISNQTTVGIEKLTNTDISIFPIPSNDYINIKSEKEFESVTIYSINGRTVLNTSNKKVDVSELKSGSYFLVLTTKNGTTYTKKWVKN